MLKDLWKACLMSLLIAGLPPLAKAASSPAPPQETEAQGSSIYRAQYKIYELENGKRVNSRSYAMLFVAPRGDWGRIRVGTRVPYSEESNKFTYADVGMNIDCRINKYLDGNRVEIYTSVESSSVVTRAGTGPSGNPVFRNVRYSGQTVVELGKPTVISEMDDVDSNHRFEIEVTVTQVK